MLSGMCLCSSVSTRDQEQVTFTAWLKLSQAVINRGVLRDGRTLWCLCAAYPRYPSTCQSKPMERPTEWGVVQGTCATRLPEFCQTWAMEPTSPSAGSTHLQTVHPQTSRTLRAALVHRIWQISRAGSPAYNSGVFFYRGCETAVGVIIG